MQTLKTTLISLAMAGGLGAALSVLAQDINDKPFEGVIVEENIVMKEFPGEVQSGSIKINDDSDQVMAELARISSSDAAGIAARALPGKVVETKLKNENGYLVWKVETVNPDRKEVEFMIDAGNGRLLAVDEEKDGEHWNWKFWEDDDKDEHHDRD